FVSQRARRQAGGGAGRHCRNVGVAPEPQTPDLRWHTDGVAARPIDRENCTREGVLGPTPVAWRSEARVTPGTRPSGWVSWIDDRVGMRFLVGNESPIWCVRAVGTVFPARLPEDLVATEECEVDTRPPRGFDIGALLTRPVFIVTNRQIHLVIENQV